MNIRHLRNVPAACAAHVRLVPICLITLALCVPPIEAAADERARGLGLTGDAPPNIALTAAVSAALFIPTVLTGYSMSGGDESPDDWLLTGHKLTAVANLGLLNYTAVQMHRIEPLTRTEVAATVVMNLCFAGAIATGALLTIEPDRPGWVRTTHRLAPYSVLLSSAGLLLLFGNR